MRGRAWHLPWPKTVLPSSSFSLFGKAIIVTATGKNQLFRVGSSGYVGDHLSLSLEQRMLTPWGTENSFRGLRGLVP